MNLLLSLRIERENRRRERGEGPRCRDSTDLSVRPRRTDVRLRILQVSERCS